MSALARIKERNEQDWSLIALQVEVGQLKRERKHLQSKSQQRPLTLWEKTRLVEAFEELTGIVSKINRAIIRKHRNKIEGYPKILS